MEKSHPKTELSNLDLAKEENSMRRPILIGPKRFFIQAENFLTHLHEMKIVLDLSIIISTTNR